MLATTGVMTFDPRLTPALEPGRGAVLAAGVFDEPFAEVCGADVMTLGDCSTLEGTEA